MKLQETPAEFRRRIRWRRFYTVVLTLWCIGAALFVYVMKSGAMPPPGSLAKAYLLLFGSILYFFLGFAPFILHATTGRVRYDAFLPPYEVPGRKP